MTGELGMAVLQQHPHIANAVLHINSTIGTLTGSQVLWLTGHTYYFQLLRLLTSALVCCMVAVFNFFSFLFWVSTPVLLSSPVSSPSFTPKPHVHEYLLTPLQLF